MSLGLKCGEWKEVCVGSPMKKLFKGILRWLKSIHPSLSLSYFIPLLRSLSHIIYHSSVDTAPLWSAALLCTAPRLHWSRPSAVSASKFTLLCHISRWSAHMLHSHQEPFNTMWCTAVTHTEPWGTVRVELETRRVNEAEEMPLQLFSPALSGQYGQDIVKTVHVTCKFRWSATICHPFGYPRERERVRLRGRRGGVFRFAFVHVRGLHTVQFFWPTFCPLSTLEKSVLISIQLVSCQQHASKADQCVLKTRSSDSHLSDSNPYFTRKFDGFFFFKYKNGQTSWFY